MELLPLCKKPPKLILVPIWYVHSYSNLVSMCTWVSNSSPHVLLYKQAFFIIRHLLTPILFSETRQIVPVGCVLQLPLKEDRHCVLLYADLTGCNRKKNRNPLSIICWAVWKLELFQRRLSLVSKKVSTDTTSTRDTEMRNFYSSNKTIYISSYIYKARSPTPTLMVYLQCLSENRGHELSKDITLHSMTSKSASFFRLDRWTVRKLLSGREHHYMVYCTTPPLGGDHVIECGSPVEKRSWVLIIAGSLYVPLE